MTLHESPTFQYLHANFLALSPRLTKKINIRLYPRYKVAQTPVICKSKTSQQLEHLIEGEFHFINIK